MRTTTKLGLAALTTAMMLTGASGFASAQEYQKAIPISAQIDASTFTLLVNGMAVLEQGYLHQDGTTVMLPLRDLAQSLGYSVIWNQTTRSVELTKGAQWTNVKLGEDRYSFAKRMITLGIAPELHNGKMFVPAAFAQQVLQAQVAQQGTAVSVTLEEKKTMTTSGFITGIRLENGQGQIHLNGTGTEGIVLNVNQDTVLIAEDGSKMKWEDLTLGADVEAVHSLAMTLSLPPQTSAYEIKVKPVPKAAADSLGTSGTIEEVTASEDGTVTVLIKGEPLSEASPAEVKLMVTKDTILVSASGEPVTADKLSKGTRVIGFYGPKLTKSLPPIGSAWKIVVLPPAE